MESVKQGFITANHSIVKNNYSVIVGITQDICLKLVRFDLNIQLKRISFVKGLNDDYLKTIVNAFPCSHL